MNLIDVLVELDNGSQTCYLARIEQENKTSYTVRYLSPTKKFYDDQVIYKYEKTVSVIDNECVSCFYDSACEEDAGMKKIDGGWIRDESESEYEPSCDPETDTESLTESESESEEY